MGVKDDVFGRGLNSNPNPINQRSCHLNGLVEISINTGNKCWS